MNPKYAEAFFSIGSIYILMNDSVKAIESFNKAEANGYESAQMYMLMATLLLQEGDETQTIRNINRAIKITPLDGKLII